MNERYFDNNTAFVGLPSGLPFGQVRRNSNCRGKEGMTMSKSSFIS